MSRQEANREILRILSEQVESQPEQRFTQLIFNLDITKQDKNPPYMLEDNYNEESVVTLENARNRAKRL